MGPDEPDPLYILKEFSNTPAKLYELSAWANKRAVHGNGLYRLFRMAVTDVVRA